tara:strand:- start:2780 stop:3247 length:468 start_codon:yes stop_codon:yes gene_type:complete
VSLVGPDPINPPEAAIAPNDGNFGPPAPEKRDDSPPSDGRYANLTRDEAKAEAVRRRLLTASARHGLPAIVAMLEKHDHETGGVSIVASENIPAGAFQVPPDARPPRDAGPDSIALSLPSGDPDIPAIRQALDRLSRAVEEIHLAGDVLRSLIGA